MISVPALAFVDLGGAVETHTVVAFEDFATEFSAICAAFVFGLCNDFAHKIVCFNDEVIGEFIEE